MCAERRKDSQATRVIVWLHMGQLLHKKGVPAGFDEISRHSFLQITNLCLQVIPVFLKGIAVKMRAAKTSDPPTIILVVIFSDKTITEESTVTTGSKVETSAAVEGPVFSIPVKKTKRPVPSKSEQS